MRHYFDVVLHPSTGAALQDVQVRLFDAATDALIPIYADENGTPIVTASGIADTAITNGDGRFSLYVVPGTYTVRMYRGDALQLVTRNVPITEGVSDLDLAAPDGAAKVGFGSETVKVALAARPTTAELTTSTAAGGIGTSEGGNVQSDLNERPTSTQLIAGDGAARVGLIQAGAGAAPRTVQDKLRERVSVFDYGAVGDGTTDDTFAIRASIAALRPGGTLQLGDGYTFRVTGSIVIYKPIRIVGGAMEQSKILFAAGGSYADIGNGSRAGIIIMHTQTVVAGYSGDARRTSFEGFAVEAQPGLTGVVRGIVISAPAYLYEIWVGGFSGDGFAVMAGGGSPIDGIANGSVFTSCIAQSNGGSGFHFSGDDSNACLINRCHGADNDGWGFFDDSLLGNTYISCEADNNGIGGYFAVSSKPNASSYLGCYSETPTHFLVGPLCQIWGAQGMFKPTRASGGIIMRGLPIGPAYLSQQLFIAASDDIANSKGDAPNAGPFMGLGDEGLDYRASATSRHIKLNQLLSTNYSATFFNGGDPIASFPDAAFAGNISPKRLHFHDGFTLGGAGKSGIVGAGTAAPTAGTFDQGAIWLNDSPIAGGKIGWICVTAGSPGIWKPWGAIDA